MNSSNYHLLSASLNSINFRKLFDELKIRSVVLWLGHHQERDGQLSHFRFSRRRCHSRWTWSARGGSSAAWTPGCSAPAWWWTWPSGREALGRSGTAPGWPRRWWGRRWLTASWWRSKPRGYSGDNSWDPGTAKQEISVYKQRSSKTLDIGLSIISCIITYESKLS